VIPVGAEDVAVPAEFVYQLIVPIVPVAILAVVTAKATLPFVLLIIVPDFAVMVTFAEVEELEFSPTGLKHERIARANATYSREYRYSN
jgi:hypothetical protein